MYRYLWIMIVGQCAALQLAVQDFDGSQPRIAHTLRHEGAITTIAIAPDGATLAAASHDKTITLWDVRSGEGRVVESGHRTRVREILFSPEGETLATRDYYDVKIWVAAGKEINAIEGQPSTTRFSADGNTLAVAIGHRVTRWTVGGEKEPEINEGEEYNSSDRFRAILSPDGKTLATIDKDLMGVDLGRDLVPAGKQRCRLILMDVETGKERTLVEKRGAMNWFGPIWYSPNGKALALWNWNDQSITLVDAATGKHQERLTAPDSEPFRKGTVPPIAFTPDGKNFVAAHDSSLTIWVTQSH